MSNRGGGSGPTDHLADRRDRSVGVRQLRLAQYLDQLKEVDGELNGNAQLRVPIGYQRRRVVVGAFRFTPQPSNDLIVLVHLERECVIPGSPRNRASGTAKLPAAFNVLKRGSMSAEQKRGHAPRAAMRVVSLGNDPSQKLAEVSLEDACV